MPRLKHILSFLLLVAFTTPTFAMTVIPLNDKQLVSKSKLIIRGRVLSKKGMLLKNGMGVATLAKIQVLQEMLGRKAPKTLYVRYFGGTVGSITAHVPGGASFSLGNEVLLVLRQSKYLPTNEYLIVGLTQGKWIVARGQKISVAPSLVRSKHQLQRKLKNWATLKAPTLSSMVKVFQKHYVTLKKTGGMLYKETIVKPVPRLKKQPLNPKVVPLRKVVPLKKVRPQKKP